MANDKNIVTKTNDGYVVELFVRDESEGEEISDGITLLKNETKKTEKEYINKYKEISQKYKDKRIMIKVSERENKEQIKAILQTAKDGDISIMFSKIATPEQLRDIKETIEQCKEELKENDISYKNNIKIGTIVEIPSVALNSYETAKECDFFFIEINSLTNYMFGNSKETSKNLQLNPGIIKLIKHTIEGAHDAGIFCGISGETIDNEIYLPLLIGLGIDEFTINKSNIEKFRDIISKIDKSDCKEIVEEIKSYTRSDEIEKKLKQFIKN